MTLKDWNQSLSRAQGYVKYLETAGLKARAVPYSTYDGRKGIRLDVLDGAGETFDCYYSGICASYGELDAALKAGADRLIRDNAPC